MDQLPARILVMTRAPVAGRTKTRLAPLLGPDGCARLQAELVRHTVAVAAAVAPVTVAVAGPLHLVQPLLPVGMDVGQVDVGQVDVVAQVDVFAQVDGDLGARMAAAVTRVRTAPLSPVPPGPPASRALRARESRSTCSRVGVVVIGTDCPQLGPAHLDAARGRLAAGDDVVFGPADDGGYYLVALGPNTPTDAVFALPPGAWGGPEVLARSLAAARSAGLRVGLLDVERDLDTPDDAAAALADPRVPVQIAALLRPTTAGGSPAC